MSHKEATLALAEFAAGIRPEDIPDRVKSYGRDLFLDALACAVAGHAGEEVAQVAAFTNALAPGKGSSIIAGGEHSLVGATLLNGFLITAITMCDAHRPTQTHITPEVVPPSLAIAERDQLSGSHLLCALIAGYEVTARIGLGLDFKTFRGRGFHGPGILGPFGAAAAVGRLRGFNVDQMARAFGLSGSQAAGTFAAWGTPTVKFHQCRGALSGLMAAMLAEQDFVATRTFLTSQDGGLYAAYSGGGDVNRVVAGLGTQWELEQIALRAWPGAAPLQGLMTAIFDIQKDSDFSAQDVDKVNVNMSQFAFNLHGGYSRYSGKFEAMLSGHYAVAAILHDRDLSLDQYAPERYNSAELRQFAHDRVLVEPSRSLSGPEATVTVALRDGRILTTTCKNPRGAPENPMSAEQVRQKFRRYAEPHFDSARIEEILKLVANLDALESTTRLTSALRQQSASRTVSSR